MVPDLVAEISSPNDGLRELHNRALMWLGHGVRLVWVVRPETRTIEVSTADGTIVTLSEQDALDGLDVLPGFSCAVSAILGPHPARERAARDR